MRPVLAILAGGASRRLGACKALVDWNGATTLELLARAGEGLRSDAPLVVSGADHDAIAARAPRSLEVVRNVRWEAGRLTSVLAARDARPNRDLCLAPVDTPRVERDVFERLAGEWEARGAPASGWLAPRTQDEPARFGHPVIVGRLLLLRLDALPLDASLRDLRQLARPLWSVACPQTSILDDLDTPGDLERLRGLEGP